jgi:hypothetical protein
MSQQMEATLENLYHLHTKQEGECRIWTGGYRSGKPALNASAWMGYAYARQFAFVAGGGAEKKHKTLYSTCKNPLCMEATHLTYTPDRSNLLEEFMCRVDRTKGCSPDPKKVHMGICWWWPDSRTRKDGFVYGYLNREKWGESLAHRWIYKLSKKLPDLSSKITVNHECNNPLCVRPDHLSHKQDEEVFNQTNINQAIDEGRMNGQIFIPTATQTPRERVAEIRRRILAGARTKDLCKEFKCSKVTIAEIKWNRSYYDPNYTPPPR